MKRKIRNTLITAATTIGLIAVATQAAIAGTVLQNHSQPITRR
jgi:hypothetical protein